MISWGAPNYLTDLSRLRFQGEGVVPGEYFLVSTKLDTLLSDSAYCTVLRAVVSTQYRCVTDGQTDRQTELT